MRKYFLAASAVGLGLLAAAPAVAAGAATTKAHAVLTNGSPGGSAVKRGAMLKAGLRGTATFYAPGTKNGITCRAASVTDRVTKNPPAGRVARELLTSQAFGHCSVSGVSGAKNVKAISVTGLPYRTTINGKSKQVVIFKARTRVTLGTILGTLTCGYGAAKVKGTASNTGQVNKFAGQTFTLTSGSAACPRKADFSATFGPITDISVRNHPHVFVN